MSRNEPVKDTYDDDDIPQIDLPQNSTTSKKEKEELPGIKRKSFIKCEEER